ncbi:hypothetical protein [Nocardiopsis nanhaiensis]
MVPPEPADAPAIVQPYPPLFEETAPAQMRAGQRSAADIATDLARLRLTAFLRQLPDGGQARESSRANQDAHASGMSTSAQTWFALKSTNQPGPCPVPAPRQGEP